jgi:HAD superfamily hydrolase (TIGR01509 family)
MLNDMNIQHVLFDNDGTLVDTEILAIRSMLSVLQPLGFEMDEATYSMRFPGLLEKDILAAIRAEYQLDLPTDDVLRAIRLEHKQLFQEQLQAIQGMPDLIKALQVPKSIVSNATRPHIEFCMEKIGVAEHLDGQIFSVELVKNPKPAADLYALAAATFQLTPDNTVVVEDSPTGIRAAKAAGLVAIGFLGAAHITEGHRAMLESAGADYIVADATALSELFQAWKIIPQS